MSLVRTIARPLVALPFLFAGFDALAHPARHRERARVAEPIADKLGVDLDDRTLDRATRGLGAAFLLAGAGLATSKLPRTSAAALTALQVPVTIANYPVWQRGRDRTGDLTGIVTSAATIGGALLAAADRDGRPSLAWRIEQRRKANA